jgi:hypothetical protein
VLSQSSEVSLFYKATGLLLARSVQVTVVGPQRHTSQRLQKRQQAGFTFLPLESLYADILEIQKLTAA